MTLSKKAVSYTHLDVYKRQGLGKVILNEEALRRDLDDNWAVVAEGIQTVLRLSLIHI